MARSVPALMYWTADGIVQNTMFTCPPSRSLSAGAVPRYGTCVIWMPVISWRSSPEAWSGPPAPPVPMLTLCGLAFA